MMGSIKACALAEMFAQKSSEPRFRKGELPSRQLSFLHCNSKLSVPMNGVLAELVHKGFTAQGLSSRTVTDLGLALGAKQKRFKILTRTLMI